MSIFYIVKQEGQTFTSIGSRPSLEAATEYASELLEKILADTGTYYIHEEVARVVKRTIKTPKIEVTYPAREPV